MQVSMMEIFNKKEEDTWQWLYAQSARSAETVRGELRGYNLVPPAALPSHMGELAFSARNSLVVSTSAA